jgi:hypothetical protein
VNVSAQLKSTQDLCPDLCPDLPSCGETIGAQHSEIQRHTSRVLSEPRGQPIHWEADPVVNRSRGRDLTRGPDLVSSLGESHRIPPTGSHRPDPTGSHRIPPAGSHACCPRPLETLLYRTITCAAGTLWRITHSTHGLSESLAAVHLGVRPRGASRAECVTKWPPLWECTLV